MAKGFKHGSGGMNLNFRVRVYALEEEMLAATPQENTIGVVTQRDLTGWVFSGTEPQGCEEGTVWFLTGERSVAGFNALKRNGIALYPLEAKQYGSGAWETVTARFFRSGSWIPWWDGYLYHQGNLCEDITGGWGAYAYKIYGSGSTAYQPTATFNADSLRLAMTKPSSGYRAGTLFSENAVDLTGYFRLKVRVASLTGLSSAAVGIGISEAKENEFVQTARTEITDAGDYTLDLTGISGLFYINVTIGGVASSGSSLVLVLDSIWLE